MSDERDIFLFFDPVTRFGHGLTYQRVRIWHNAVLYWRLHTNSDSCAAGAKYLTHPLSQNGAPQAQEINSTTEASKDLGDSHPRPRCYSKQTTALQKCQEVGTNVRRRRYSRSMSSAGNCIEEPIPLQVHNWFEFQVSLLVKRLSRKD